MTDIFDRHFSPHPTLAAGGWTGAVRVAGFLSLASLIGACGSQAPADPLLDSPLAIHDGEWNGDDGAIEGRLELRGDCLYLASAGGVLLYLVFGRDGLEWDSTAQAVRIDNATFVVSQTVRFGGGGGMNPPALNGIRWLNPPAAGCDTSRVWFAAR